MAFSLGNAPVLVQALIVLGFIIAVGSMVLGNLGDTIGSGEGDGNCAYDNRTDCPVASNATYSAQDGSGNFAQQMGNLGMIAGVAVLLGLVMQGFIGGRL